MADHKNNNNGIPMLNDENIENIQKLKNLLNSEKSDIFQILSLRKKITFNDKSEEDKINNDIWQKQYSEFFPPKDSLKTTKPTINKINVLLSLAEEYKIKDKEKINKIKLLQEQGNNYIKEISKLKNLQQLDIYKSNIDKINLDLNEYLIQREIKLKTSKEESITTNPSSKQNNNASITFITKEVSTKQRRRKNYKKKEDSYEADFIHDEEDSSNSELIEQMIENKKEGSSFKRYADALQKEAESFVNSRSRRNVNKKRDDDFVYEDDLKNEVQREELGLDSGEEKNDLVEISNNSKKRKKKANEGDEEYSEDSSEIKKEKKEKTRMLNKKIKRINEENKSIKIVPLNSDENNKMKSRQKALSTITEILKDNKYLMEEGIDFVNALATRVEEDLAKAYPLIDFDYQKTLANMNKTLKEISKYKRINQLIIKGKLILFKMAKFSYGEKFIQKLKKVEEGNQNKKPVNKPKPITNSALDIFNQISEENNKKDKLNLKKNVSNVSNISYKSAFSQSSFNDERNYDNNDSLESIEEQGNVRFSPGGTNRNKIEVPGNLEEGLGHAYDPFRLDKNNSKNILYPILFDPSLSQEEDEMSEENVSNYDNEENDLILSEQPHKGSVLRIFHGKIRLNHNTIDKVGLYSFNKYEKFLKFPAFEKELVLPSKAKSNEVIPYCLKQLNNKSKLELFGWIEPEAIRNQEMVEISKFSELIEEFESNEKCSCLVDNKIKLYVFTLSQKDEALFNKIIKKDKFINKRFMNSLNSGNKFLVFVLLANNDDLENDVIKKKKKIHPEVITNVENSESEEEDEYSNPKKNKNLSIVMEEEEENMPSSSMKKRKISKEENEANNEEDEESLIDKEENEKLRLILEQNDFNTINQYIETNFKDLPLEEMANKLQRFSSENREKLLIIIKSYSERFSGNDNGMDVEENNNNMNQMQQMNNVGLINQMNNMNNNYGINMYQNDPTMNQMYLGGMNNVNIQQQLNNNNDINLNPNLQQIYYNQGMNIYNNYNQNFK